MARKIRIGTASRAAGSVRRSAIRSLGRLLAGRSTCVSLLIRDPAPEHSPIGHILLSNGQDRAIRLSSFRAIVEAYVANSFPPQRSWGGARAAGGGVMSSRTVAHDPSGPAGHLPSFAGEDSAFGRAIGESYGGRAKSSWRKRRRSPSLRQCSSPPAA